MEDKRFTLLPADDGSGKVGFIAYNEIPKDVADAQAQLAQTANDPNHYINYINWAKKKELCDQCTYPWNDGLCECDNGSKYNDKINQIVEHYNKINRNIKISKEEWDELEKELEEEFKNEDIKRKQEDEIYMAKMKKKTVDNPKWVSKLNNKMMNTMMKHLSENINKENK